MTKNITYLFGAGASANTIPVLSDLPSSMRECANFINALPRTTKSYTPQNVNGIDYIPDTLYSELAKSIQLLANKAEGHASIDTYAKKEFLKGRSTQEIRTVLMCYLTIMQFRKSSDKRYDTFYASLLQKSVFDFPPNVKILSWNYDNQFEKSFFEFSDGDKINVISEKRYSSNMPKPDAFGIYQLNGSCGIMFGSIKHDICDLNTNSKEEQMIRVAISYAKLIHDPEHYEPAISFAWDTSPFIEAVKVAMRPTEILVIIGYSIPYFNRLIDKEILGNMLSLRKVYIQSPYPQIIQQRLNAVNIAQTSQVELISDVKDFLLPNEL